MGCHPSSSADAQSLTDVPLPARRSSSSACSARKRSSSPFRRRSASPSSATSASSPGSSRSSSARQICIARGAAEYFLNPPRKAYLGLTHTCTLVSPHLQIRTSRRRSGRLCRGSGAATDMRSALGGPEGEQPNAWLRHVSDGRLQLARETSDLVVSGSSPCVTRASVLCGRTASVVPGAHAQLASARSCASSFHFTPAAAHARERRSWLWREPPRPDATSARNPSIIQLTGAAGARTEFACSPASLGRLKVLPQPVARNDLQRSAPCGEPQCREVAGPLGRVTRVHLAPSVLGFPSRCRGIVVLPPTIARALMSVSSVAWRMRALLLLLLAAEGRLLLLLFCWRVFKRRCYLPIFRTTARRRCATRRNLLVFSPFNLHSAPPRRRTVESSKMWLMTQWRRWSRCCGPLSDADTTGGTTRLCLSARRPRAPARTLIEEGYHQKWATRLQVRNLQKKRHERKC